MQKHRTLNKNKRHLKLPFTYFNLHSNMRIHKTNRRIKRSPPRSMPIANRQPPFLLQKHPTLKPKRKIHKVSNDSKRLKRQNRISNSVRK
jgi:hypothetical protein